MKTRQWFTIHSFMGVWLGLLLFIVCYSGTVATLSYEIDWLLTPAMQVEAKGISQPWSRLYAEVNQQYPDASIQLISFPPYANAAAEVVIKRQDESRARVFVNPYTATVTGRLSTFNTQRFFRSFHRHFFMPKPWGIYLAAIAALAVLVSMISGLYFYKRWWTRFFQFKLGKGRAWMHELHKLSALWSLWFGLLIAVTGLWYALEATGLPHQWLAPDKPEVSVEMASGQTLTLPQLAARVQTLRPEWSVRRVIPPGSFLGEHRLRVIGVSPNSLLRDRVNNLTLTTGGELETGATADDLTAYETWVNVADPLHFGDFGGLVSKLIWFVMGVMLTGVCLSGTWLYVKRVKRRPQSRRQGAIGACLVALVVLIAATGLGLQSYSEAVDVPVLVSGSVMSPAVAVFIAGWWVTTALVALGFVWFLSEPKRSNAE